MSQLEQVRAYVEGTMADAERIAFEVRLSADPDLARMAESYDLVVRATDDEVPARTLTFDDIELPVMRAPMRNVRWAAAAAVLIAIGGVSGWMMTRDEVAPVPSPDVIALAPPELQLNAIPLSAVDAPDVPEWPRTLIDYRTTDDNGLAWLTDPDEAEELAAASDRPLLVFVHLPDCPYCKQYARVQFRDDAVMTPAEDYVLLKVTAGRLPAWISRSMPEGWPIIAVFNSDGKRLEVVTGLQETNALSKWMRGASDKLRKSNDFDFPAWDVLQEDARTLEAAEESDDPAFRLQSWRKVEGDIKRGTLAQVARNSRIRMESMARNAIDQALAATPAEADSILTAAEKTLAGTDYAQDLARVREHIAKYGTPPVLR
jgi:hypothetical protein